MQRKIHKTKKSKLFRIPEEISWQFERSLKPDDKTIDNYVIIQPGASDITKVLKAYFHHPVPGFDIATIEIVYNEHLNRLFYGHMKTMNARKGNPKYTPTWKTQTQGLEKQHRENTYQLLQQFAAPNHDPELPNIMILPLWHGTSDETAHQIFKTGFGIFNSNNPQVVTDEGYFGRGVYTTHEAEYAFRCYAQQHADNAVLILSCVSTFEAYPTIKGDMPKDERYTIRVDNCDAHFIPVRSDSHPNTNIYYPCAPDEKPQYIEMVVFNSAQCLPRYRVQLVKSTPKPSIDKGAVTSYQMGFNFLALGRYAQAVTAFEDRTEVQVTVAHIFGYIGYIRVVVV